MENVNCPICGVKLNIKTDNEVDFDVRKADSKVWCVPCQRYIKFSMKKKPEQTAEEKK